MHPQASLLLQNLHLLHKCLYPTAVRKQLLPSMILSLRHYISENFIFTFLLVSPTPVKTSMMVLKPSLSLEFPPRELRILTDFSKSHHTIRIFSLKILYSEFE